MPLKSSLMRALSSAWLQALCRLVLGGIFIYASLDKIAHPREFAQIIANYGILPDFLVTLPALVLPWLELIAGMFLAAGVWRRSSALWLSLLLLAFILALGVNAVRGLDMSCGCFSTSAADTESAYVLIFRDLLILIPGLVIVFFGRDKGDMGKSPLKVKGKSEEEGKGLVTKNEGKKNCFEGEKEGMNLIWFFLLFPFYF